MKLTTIMQVSVDGVMQGIGGSDPDLDPGFERGGWANGSGKTTLAKVLAGLYLPERGTVRWDGRPTPRTTPSSS